MFRVKDVFCAVALLLCFKASRASSTSASGARPPLSNSVVVVFVNEKRVRVKKRVYCRDGSMFRTSGYMKRALAWMDRDRRQFLEIRWDPEIFDMTAKLFERRLQDRPGADDTVEILHLMEYLCIDDEHEAEHYAELARRTRKIFKEDSGELSVFSRLRKQARVALRAVKRYMTVDADTEEDWVRFEEDALKEWKHIRSFRIYVLQLLRVCAREHGMCVSANEESGTFCLMRCSSGHGEHTSTAKAVESGEWKLRIEMDRAYASHADVESAVAMLVEAMDIGIVNIDVAKGFPESSAMIDALMQRMKAQQKNLNVTFHILGPRTIAEYFEELKNSLLELDVSWNSRLNDEDWDTVGRMDNLKRLAP